MKVVLLPGLQRLISTFSSGFYLGKQVRQREGVASNSHLGFPHKSRLLLGEDSPQSQHYSFDHFLHLTARQAGQEADSTLI